jgi:hypothetical protein
MMPTGFRQALIQKGIAPCIPPKKHRKIQIEYNRALYKQRHKVENEMEFFQSEEMPCQKMKKKRGSYFIVKKPDIDLRKVALKTAMARLKKLAKEQHPDFIEFSFHNLKRKGVTDTVGVLRNKLRAGGHQSPQMLKVYDKEVAVVKPIKD